MLHAHNACNATTNHPTTTQETLEWLARPENVNSDVLPPGLETWDPTTYIATALPISLGVFGVALMRELGTRLAAGVKGVKLGPAFFIPNGQIGMGRLFGGDGALLCRQHMDCV